MKLFLAADHAGFDAKENLKKISHVGSQKIEWVDLGPANKDSVDYPLFAQKLCEEVLKTVKGEDLKDPCGVLICGSGVGMSIAANRYSQIRAALVDRLDIAELSRQHNASNVLCLGSRILSEQEMKAIFEKWFSTPFMGDRHTRRVDQMTQINKQMGPK